MITRMHSATVIVKDQDAALDFYTSKLGWEKRDDQPMGEEEGRWLTVAPKGSVTELHLGFVNAHSESEGMSPGGFSGITFLTDDIDATYKELSGKGVQFQHAPETMPWGSKATWFSDPDGNSFFLTEDE